MKHSSALLLVFLMGCAATPNQKKDRLIYRAMQAERKALRLEEKCYNLTNVNALQDIIDRNGFERSRLEGYMP